MLRRPPLGKIAPSSHDMKREHRILSRLYKAFPLAPRSYLLCTDPGVIGAEFHVMERRHGIAIRSEIPTRFANRPELNRRIGHMLVDTLADFHMVDPDRVGLGDLGHPEGFVARQLEGWSKRWHAAKDEDIAEIDAMIAWLSKDVPNSKHVSLLHNDFKLDNMLLDPNDPAVPRAVLDWDMCTRGDPLMDLGHMLNYYVDASDPVEMRSQLPLPTWHEGFPLRGEITARYGEKTGFDVSRIGWYYTFGVFKLAVILQQIYIRYLRGQTQDERFASFGTRVRALGKKGVELIP